MPEFTPSDSETLEAPQPPAIYDWQAEGDYEPPINETRVANWLYSLQLVNNGQKISALTTGVLGIESYLSFQDNADVRGFALAGVALIFAKAAIRNDRNTRNAINLYERPDTQLNDSQRRYLRQ